MSRRAILKRKIEALDDESQALSRLLSEWGRACTKYKDDEVSAFFECRLNGRVVRTPFEVRIAYENGITLHIRPDHGQVDVWRDNEIIGSFRVSGACVVNSNDSWLNTDQRMSVLASLLEIYPDIRRITQEFLPLLMEASKDLDVESLMTTRVLHWIAKQYDPTPLADIMEEVLIKMF